MAASELCRQEVVPTQFNESTVINTDSDPHCLKCEKLNGELQLVKKEIASYVEIVRLLKQEISLETMSTAKTNLDDMMPQRSTGSPRVNPATPGEWKLDTSKKYAKMKRNSEKCMTRNSVHFNMSAVEFPPLTQTNEQRVNIVCDSASITKVQNSGKPSAYKEVGRKIPTIINGRIFNSEVMSNHRIKKDSKRLIPKKHQVIFIGDSHLRGCAVGTNQFLNTSFTVNSLIKPGAKIGNIVTSLETECNALSKNDVVVISAGTNDIYNNNDKGNEVIYKMTQFVLNHCNTNIVIVGVPHRHDLDKDSQINRAIREINNRLLDKAKRFHHVSMIQVDRDRRNYTKQGLHLNKLGKEGLARQMAKQIIKLTKKEPVIKLPWKDNKGIMTPEQEIPKLNIGCIIEGTDECRTVSTELPTADDMVPNKGEGKVLLEFDMNNGTIRTNSTEQLEVDQNCYSLGEEVGKTLTRCSTRQKKTPVNRNSDFLWA